MRRSTKKLTSTDIIRYMQDGAILRNEYCVYSYWKLILQDGRIIYDFFMRKGSIELAKSKIKYEVIESDKTGYSIKMK